MFDVFAFLDSVLMGLSMWAGLHQDRSAGKPTKPCQSQIIRLGLDVMPKEMAVFYTLL